MGPAGSSADGGLRVPAIVRETAALVIQRPVSFVLLPWILVGASSTALWAVAHFGVFRWLMPVYLGFDMGSDASVFTLLTHLALAIAATAWLIVLVDEAGVDRLRGLRVRTGLAVRRVAEVAAISSLISVPVLVLAPLSLILPLSLLGVAGSKPFLSLLVFLVALALACGLAWLLATQSVALAVAVIEGAGTGSLRRSWQLTRGYRWRISALIGPLVALVAVLFLYVAEAVAPPANMFDQFPPPITALDRVIDIAGRSFTLGVGLGIAMVMTTLTYRRLVAIKG